MIDPKMKQTMQGKLNDAMGSTPPVEQTTSKTIDQVQVVEGGKVSALFSGDDKPKVYDSFDQFSEEAETFLGIADPNSQDEQSEQMTPTNESVIGA